MGEFIYFAGKSNFLKVQVSFLFLFQPSGFPLEPFDFLLLFLLKAQGLLLSALEPFDFLLLFLLKAQGLLLFALEPFDKVIYSKYALKVSQFFGVFLVSSISSKKQTKTSRPDTLQMFTGNYGGPAGKICNIYGKGL